MNIFSVITPLESADTTLCQIKAFISTLLTAIDGENERIETNLTTLYDLTEKASISTTAAVDRAYSLYRTTKAGA